MASSSYYYNLYKQKRNEANKYEEDLRDLRKILNKLTGSMGDEIRAVNNELDDLKEDLKDSVRHNDKFSQSVRSISSEKEKAVTKDRYLRVAVNELEDEISRVTGLKNQAVKDRDYYKRKYEEEKAEERRELLAKLNNLI